MGGWPHPQPAEKTHENKRKTLCQACLAAALADAVCLVHATDKPNILVIFGDDIGYFNLSAYNQGMMGYETPNIDRIAKEGALFTHAYGEQSSRLSPWRICAVAPCGVRHRLP